MAHSNSNRSDLAIVDPNARERCALCRCDLVLGQHFNEQLLEPPQISVQILTAPAQVDNGIPHQLSGSVIRRLTSTIDREEWMWQMRGAQQTGLIRSTPNCVNRFVLEQEQFVRMGRICSFFRDNFFLQSKSISEVRPAKPMDLETWRAELLRRRLRFTRHRLHHGLAGVCPSLHICVAP